MNERPSGFVAAAARFSETWYMVVFGGPRAYAPHDLPVRYSQPGEFACINFFLCGVATLGFDAIFRYAGDTGVSAASAAELVAAMLAATGFWLLWSVCALLAAKAMRTQLPLSAVWRIATYSTAPTVVTFPLLALWQQSLDIAYPNRDFTDLVWFRAPAVIIAAWALSYFLVSIYRIAAARRVAVAVTALLLIGTAGSLGVSIMLLPPINAYVLRASRAKFADDRLMVWDKSRQSWTAEVSAAPGEGITTLLRIANDSKVTARNVTVSLRGPAYDAPGHTAVLWARVT